MLIPHLWPKGAASLVDGPGRSRKLTASLAAALVMSCSLYVGVINGAREFEVVFHAAPRDILPPPLTAQVMMVRKLVPKGSFLLYLVNQPEAWQFGLWKRSLFPDYTILPVASSAMFNSPWVKAFRVRHNVRYVILAGSTLPGVSKKVTLPEYPQGTTTALAELGD